MSTEILKSRPTGPKPGSNEVNRLLGEIASFSLASPSRTYRPTRWGRCPGRSAPVLSGRGEILTSSVGLWRPSFGTRLDALLGRDPSGPDWRLGHLANAVGGDLKQLTRASRANLMTPEPAYWHSTAWST